MAAGWFDYLRKVLGRTSSFNPTAGPPYRVVAGQTFCTGAFCTGAFRTGAFCTGLIEGSIFHTGIVAGEVDGRAN